ncbi:hypothetical phage repetitive protein [Pseudomonas phage phi2]|uniref:Hypothetical phage repetitive protein n=1 Tax=Pseudomonas phage phi2 TaxID=1450169 RepID=D2EBU4_9CAUD|nr:hypothetical phage repetitive protein [Pseudomonas phage phi-2]CBH51613.1 hypothetical phage repetitive protein [Pseudomonas phage phi-2]
MARHWYKLDDHSVTCMVGRGRSAPPISAVAHGFAPSLLSYICDIRLRVDMSHGTDRWSTPPTDQCRGSWLRSVASLLYM